MKKFKRIHIIVMDSVGIGEAPDAAKFGDAGAHTLLHIAQSMPEGLNVPNMQKMGLGNIYKIKGINTVYMPTAYYTKMQERSSGKDTMTGHWEMMGLYIAKPFHTFPDGFPAELITKIEEFSGRKVIGNCTASGTEIIKQYGERQMNTGELIVYTSADSVLQIAAHEEVIPLDELYKICQYCRDITKDEPYSIGRIIARPYVGSDAGSFIRTPNRRDFSLKPFGKTVLDTLKEAGLATIAIGKIHDIFDGQGITKSIHTVSNMDGVDKLLEVMDQDFTGLSFTNLVEFDSRYGHRRDPIGYGKALEEFDARIEEIQSKLRDDDLLILTADHGNDPTFKGTDHTREFVPLLVFSNGLKSYGALPVCDTFADLGATVADNFEVNAPHYGKSFLDKLI